MTQSTSSLVDFLVRTSASQVKVQDSPVNAPASGMNTTVSSKKSGRVTSSLKMLQPFGLVDWMQCSGASLRSGTMQNGTVYPLPPLAPLTRGTGSGFWATPTTMDHMAPKTDKAALREITELRPGRKNWSNLRDQVVRGREMCWPTPAARDYRGANGYETTLKKLSEGGRPHLDQLPNAVQLAEGRPIRGTLNPQWVEWLMGFPDGWTDLSNSETP